jgi:hypothetical protein
MDAIAKYQPPRKWLASNSSPAGGVADSTFVPDHKESLSPRDQGFQWNTRPSLEIRTIRSVSQPSAIAILKDSLGKRVSPQTQDKIGVLLARKSRRAFADVALQSRPLPL